MAAIVIEECREEAQIARTFPVMVQLRPWLERATYAASVGEVLADGARLIAALDGKTCVGCSVFRREVRLALQGAIIYVDDLVTDEEARSSGVGAALLDWIEKEAVAQGVRACVLDSGVHRQRAHRFYFRQGYAITSFNFKKSLQDPD